MLNIKKIANRIKRAAGLGLKIDALEIENLEAARELIVEDTITNVLAELMESLNKGESLEEAIATIHENF